MPPIRCFMESIFFYSHDFTLQGSKLQAEMTSRIGYMRSVMHLLASWFIVLASVYDTYATCVLFSFKFLALIITHWISFSDLLFR